MSVFIQNVERLVEVLKCKLVQFPIANVQDKVDLLHFTNAPDEGL